MEGCMVSGIQLKVTLARRQPRIEPINEASSSATWSTIGEIFYDFYFNSNLIV
jgi:negative elongation factor E